MAESIRKLLFAWCKHNWLSLISSHAVVVCCGHVSMKPLEAGNTYPSLVSRHFDDCFGTSTKKLVYSCTVFSRPWRQVDTLLLSSSYCTVAMVLILKQSSQCRDTRDGYVLQASLKQAASLKHGHNKQLPHGLKQINESQLCLGDPNASFQIDSVTRKPCIGAIYGRWRRGRATSSGSMRRL